MLPGVGHFAAFVAGLRERNLTAPLRAAYRRGRADSGNLPRLAGDVRVERRSTGRRGPRLFPGAGARAADEREIAAHRLESAAAHAAESSLLRGIPDDAYFYFAHSFAAPATAEPTVAACDHGFPFAAVIERGNLRGVQFHPEKSGETGAQVLRNFLESIQ